MIEEVKYAGKVYRPLGKKDVQEISQAFWRGVRGEGPKLFVFLHYTPFPSLDEIDDVQKVVGERLPIIHSKRLSWSPVSPFDIFYEVQE